MCWDMSVERAEGEGRVSAFAILREIRWTARAWPGYTWRWWRFDEKTHENDKAFDRANGWRPELRRRAA